MNNADVSDCRAPGNPLISVTFFRNAAARSLSTKELTLEELAQKINETSASEKSELPWCADSDEVARVYRYEVARGFRDDVAHLSDLISPGGEAF